MNSQLIIKQGIIFFDSLNLDCAALSLKLCHGNKIYKFHDFTWNITCRRWQREIDMTIPWPDYDEITLEVYRQQENKNQNVFGEGIISLTHIQTRLGREIRMLTYDGLHVGNLYCLVCNREEEDYSLSRNFIYIHKLQLCFLDDSSKFFQLKMLRNQELIFEKEFQLQQKGKSLFPNIKIPVKMSDIFIIYVKSRQIKIREIRFLIQNVRRGKTSTYEVWLRNEIKNKMGELKIDYFLDNLYLQNQRQIFIRNGIFGKSLIGPLNLAEQDKQRIRRSVIIKNIMEADKRFIKVDKSMRKIIKKMQTKQRIATKKALTEEKPHQKEQRKNKKK